MDDIMAQPWFEQLIDWKLLLQERLQDLPWEHIDEWLSRFVFYYPLLMAYVWMLGGILYYWRWERKRGSVWSDVPDLAEYPPVSILIPCYNEGENVRETIEYLLHQKYPNFEIIAINDGSKDNTLEILHELADQHSKLRVVNLASNQGKAVGLRTAALLANSEILIGIDGDALLAPNATAWIVRHFLEDPNVGAVTGNPRIRNRSTLLGKIQVGEFSAIVGMIKRAQRSYGHIFTISGVIAGFRKSALHDVGYWSPDMVTEDIDISWKLQLAGWMIRFEPNALCWVLMPETLKGLWKQRSRWAQGGVEVMLRYFRSLFNWRSRGMWPLYLECCISLSWAFLVVGMLAWVPWQWVSAQQPAEALEDLSPHWTSMLLCVTCLIQFGVSLAIDARYERQNGQSAQHYYWMIWYPIVYWLINVGTTINGCISALRKKRGQRAVWVTLDRGLRSK
ncbi:MULTISPECIES: poly-beta-1,6-N-acetyl-D-glucosamine synthase [Methylomonas]|uniref:poly-beta-1,6-N-acetyl-D-glucosamine synthase n=1 Tax=Methylomonas TaxID=416 RepID=UPI000B1FEC4A|nr:MULTISPECIES: poly-beta-1,6-N-acetyl-D-glucosamine synthase [Methylomonas]NJA06950.1 poly-beta-1,6 N-acetyl-D-glucosamine synthase [Methylococcaceae bacterium WWC4]